MVVFRDDKGVKTNVFDSKVHCEQQEEGEKVRGRGEERRGGGGRGGGRGGRGGRGGGGVRGGRVLVMCDIRKWHVIYHRSLCHDTSQVGNQNSTRKCYSVVRVKESST